MLKIRTVVPALAVVLFIAASTAPTPIHPLYQAGVADLRGDLVEAGRS